MAQNIYQRAWELFLSKVEAKTSWGRIELKELMAQCLVGAGKPTRRSN